MGSLRRILWEAVQIIVIALILNLLLRAFVFETRIVPTGSMIPTIKPGDRLAVDKIVYKFKGEKKNNHIKRGDIITFYPPKEAYLPGEPTNGIFTKRVIGLPGDTVQIKVNDGVYVNGKKLDEPYVNDVIKIGIQNPRYFGTTDGPFKVPPNSLFVLGDNRNNSRDSRYWGFASMDKVTGEPFYIIWPPSRMGWLR